MAKNNTVSDPYLEHLNSEIKKINDEIKAANEPRFKKISELEAMKKNYQNFKKQSTDS